jgi:hypothetical protein
MTSHLPLVLKWMVSAGAVQGRACFSIAENWTQLEDMVTAEKPGRLPVAQILLETALVTIHVWIVDHVRPPGQEAVSRGLQPPLLWREIVNDFKSPFHNLICHVQAAGPPVHGETVLRAGRGCSDDVEMTGRKYCVIPV